MVIVIRTSVQLLKTKKYEISLRNVCTFYGFIRFFLKWFHGWLKVLVGLEKLIDKKKFL